MTEEVQVYYLSESEAKVLQEILSILIPDNFALSMQSLIGFFMDRRPLKEKAIEAIMSGAKEDPTCSLKLKYIYIALANLYGEIKKPRRGRKTWQ